MVRCRVWYCWIDSTRSTPVYRHSYAFFGEAIRWQAEPIARGYFCCASCHSYSLEAQLLRYLATQHTQRKNRQSDGSTQRGFRLLAEVRTAYIARTTSCFVWSVYCCHETLQRCPLSWDARVRGSWLYPACRRGLDAFLSVRRP